MDHNDPVFKLRLAAKTILAIGCRPDEAAFATEGADEIERLRELVKEAFEEGYLRGVSDGYNTTSEPDESWDQSDAKKELAGAISSRSEELEK